MSELEEFQKALGRPAEAEGSLASLRKALWAFSPNTKGLLRASVVLEGQSDKGSEPKTPVVHIEPEPPAVQAAQEAHKPSTDDQEVLHRLREIEKKYRKKSDEAEKLRVRLQREEKARQEAERLRGKAEQEAAHLRRDREQAHQNAEGLRDELVKAQGERSRLQEENEVLKGRIEDYEKRVREHEARIRELEGAAAQREQLEARLAQLQRFKEALPEPFPEEALLRVLVLDYPSLGGKAEERVTALIEGYRAFLAGESHPALLHSNRDLLECEAEGIVLVGLERLLLDLSGLPLARWLRTHAFRLETLLQPGPRPSSPRFVEEP